MSATFRVQHHHRPQDTAKSVKRDRGLQRTSDLLLHFSASDRCWIGLSCDWPISSSILMRSPHQCVVHNDPDFPASKNQCEDNLRWPHKFNEHVMGISGQLLFQVGFPYKSNRAAVQYLSCIAILPRHVLRLAPWDVGTWCAFFGWLPQSEKRIKLHALSHVASPANNNSNTRKNVF